jgi:hypothetical protein
MAQRISAPNTNRSVVVPTGPISGKSCLASEAPVWKDTIATSTARIANSMRLSTYLR